MTVKWGSNFDDDLAGAPQLAVDDPDLAGGPACTGNDAAPCRWVINHRFAKIR